MSATTEPKCKYLEKVEAKESLKQIESTELPKFEKWEPMYVRPAFQVTMKNAGTLHSKLRDEINHLFGIIGDHYFLRADTYHDLWGAEIDAGQLERAGKVAPAGQHTGEWFLRKFESCEGVLARYCEDLTEVHKHYSACGEDGTKQCPAAREYRWTLELRDKVNKYIAEFRAGKRL